MKIKDITTENLIKELERRGFKWGYVHGHGSDEPCSWIDPQTKENYVIADVEKTTVLIRPEDQFNEPEKYDSYF